jgi:thiol-disulfide isomerase/thioredoxin
MTCFFKPIIAILVTSLSFTRVFAQYKQIDSCVDFTLNIYAKNHPTDTVRILFYDCETANDHNDIIPLSQGKATISAKVNRATEAVFFVDPKYRMFDGPGVIRFIIQPGVISLSFIVDEGQPKEVVITGSAAQKQKERWEKDNAAIFAAENAILYQQWAAIDKIINTKDSVWAKKRKQQLSDSIGLLRGQRNNQALAFVKAEPASFFSAYLLNHYKRSIPLDSLTKYYSFLSLSVRQSDFGKNLLKEIVTLTNDLSFLEKFADSTLYKSFKNISSLYDISLTNLQDAKISFSQYRGKYLLLDFWGSWCVPCFKNAPYLEQLMTELKGKAIEFISVSIDQDVSTWKASVKKHNYPGINLFDGNGILSTYYRVLWAPRYLIITPDGNVANADAPQPISGELKDLLLKTIAEK